MSASRHSAVAHLGLGPLVDLFETVVRIFEGRRWSQAELVECLDLMTSIGQAIVVGGAACFGNDQPVERQRRPYAYGQVGAVVATTTATGAGQQPGGVHGEARTSLVFMDEMNSLYKSYSGERGIFNREGIQKKKIHGRRDHGSGVRL